MKTDPRDEIDRLLQCALRVADGEIDSEADGAPASDDADRSALDSFRLIAEVARAHRAAAGTTLEDEIDASAPIPESFGRFAIHERIGRGTFGEVFRATDRTLGRVVALKLLHPRDGVRGVLARADLLEEARRLASVKHPNVVTIYSAERLDGREAIALELVEGRTLGELVRTGGRFGASEIVSTGTELCRALAAVHNAGLFHLDVKPENVMREDGGRLVLMDFSPGAATPMCAAPEVLRGEKATARADVYGAGVVFFYLATGRYPFDAETLEELRAAHAAGTSISLRDLRPDLPAPLVHAIERARALDPKERPASIGELERFLSATVSTPAALSAPARAPRVSRRPFLFAAIAAVVVAALLVVTNARRPSAVDGARSAVPAPSVAPSSAPIATGSFTIDAAFYASSKSDRRLAAGDRIAVGDSLRLDLRATRELFVYVVNEDDAGAAYLLFPLPTLDRANPLPADATTTLPGSRDGEPTSWVVTSEGGRERIIVVASARRLDALEDELFALNRAEAGRAPEFPALNETAKGLLRGIGGLGESKKAAPERPLLLAELAKPLSNEAETVDDVWIRRLDLVNATAGGESAR